jgi:hypothetical protein
MPGEVVPYRTDYEAVAAGAADQILGPTGKVGDVLERLIVQVTTLGAGGACSIKDGNGSAIPITTATTPVGQWSIAIGARCVNTTTPGWKVTTGANCTAVAVGRFS